MKKPSFLEVTVQTKVFVTIAVAGLVCFSHQIAQSTEINQTPQPINIQAKVPQLLPDIAKPTFCANEDKVWDELIDADVTIKPGYNLTVMFHGNRFPASKALVAAFEKKNPSIKISYSSLPPISILQKLSNNYVPNSPDQKEILDKVSKFPFPDVVMIAEDNLLVKQVPSNLQSKSNPVADALVEPKIYSRIKGVVAVMRSDETRIAKIKDLKTTEVKFVLAGQQSQSRHAIFKEPIRFFGNELFDNIKKRQSTGFSKMIHHRSVPARILMNCEDVGFQFAQSQVYLEERFPGKFKFFDLPNSGPNIFDGENSYISVTKRSSDKENAEKFVNFVLGPEGQSILQKYKIGL